jgi:hypothetical protein
MADPKRPLRVPDRTSSMLSVPEPSEATQPAGFHRRERSRTITGLMELQVPEMLKIRRWDGAARACSPWDSLGRVGNRPIGQTQQPQRRVMTTNTSLSAGPRAVVP